MKNSEIKVFCRDLNRHGQAVCVEVNDDGELDNKSRVIFVDGLLMGESGFVEVMETRKNYRVARLSRRIDDSPDRVDMPCAIADDCGGCQIQALSYPASLRWKENSVRQSLERIGTIDVESLVQPIIGASEPYTHYRNKMVYPVGSDAAGSPALGFFRARSHDLVTTPVCLIEPRSGARLRELLPQLMLKHDISAYDEKTHTGDLRFVTLRVAPTLGKDESEKQMIILTSRVEKDAYLTLAADLLQEEGVVSVYLNIQAQRSNVILGDRYILLGGDEQLSFTFDGIKFALSPGAFFQINYEQTSKLYRLISSLVEDTHAKRELYDIIDLYCGVGSIGLYVLNDLRKDSTAALPHLLGLELIAEAVADAKQNAELNAFAPEDYDFVRAAADESLTYITEADSERTLLILDPPRKGLDAALLSTLVEEGPSHLLYVSCNPATLARDLKELTDVYEICLIQPVDMFPWTTHVETVVLMSKVNK